MDNRINAAAVRNCCNHLRQGKDVRKQLIFLRQVCRDEAGRRLWNEVSASNVWSQDGNTIVMKCLSDSDPKVRRNAALVLGLLGDPEAVDVIMDAYEAEEQMYVRAAYPEALQTLPCEEWLPVLKKRFSELLHMQPKEEEEKHIREELHALSDLLWIHNELKPHKFTADQRPLRVFLRTDPGFVPVVSRHVTERHRDLRGGVLVDTERMGELFSIRPVREFLFPIAGSRFDEDAEQLAGELLDAGMLDFLQKTHDGDGPFFFRIQIPGGGQREEKGNRIRHLAVQIERQSGMRLINSASHYEAELRLIPKKDGGWLPFWKLFTRKDERFLYRRQLISAGMQPYLSAGLTELAEPYLKEHAQVLDAFCGAGIWLIERNYWKTARSSYGIDTFGEAVQKARINAETAKMTIHFINRSYFDFSHDYLFDEILADFPDMSGKSGEETDAFYRKFFEKSYELLKDNGVLLCYSSEIGTIRKQMRLQKTWKLLRKFQIAPSNEKFLFVIGKN